MITSTNGQLLWLTGQSGQYIFLLNYFTSHISPTTTFLSWHSFTPSSQNHWMPIICLLSINGLKVLATVARIQYSVQFRFTISKKYVPKWTQARNINATMVVLPYTCICCFPLRLPRPTTFHLIALLPWVAAVSCSPTLSSSISRLEKAEIFIRCTTAHTISHQHIWIYFASTFPTFMWARSYSRVTFHRLFDRWWRYNYVHSEYQITCDMTNTTWSIDHHWHNTLVKTMHVKIIATISLIVGLWVSQSVTQLLFDEWSRSRRFSPLCWRCDGGGFWQ